MDLNQKLQKMMKERNWTAYRLAKESGLSESTLTNLFKRNTLPTIPTLEAICDAFGITLSQFFAEAEMVELTPELKMLFENWKYLTPQQKSAVQLLLQSMSNCNE